MGHVNEQALARQVAEDLSPDQRAAMLAWMKELLAIRHGPGSWAEKSRRAVTDTATARSAISALFRGAGRTLRKRAWDDRSWSGRLGIGGAAATAAVLGGKAAGLAAFGTAVAVPLWVVAGAGGAFAGILVEELERALGGIAQHKGDTPPASPGSEGRDWEVITDWEPERLPEDTDSHSTREPLRRVFTRAYRAARARQRSEGTSSKQRERVLPAPAERVGVADDFAPLRTRFAALNERHNPVRKDLHFSTRLVDVGPDLWTELLDLADEGLITVQAHRAHFAAAPLYDDGMFWYGLLQLIRATAETIRYENRSQEVPPTQLRKMVQRMVGISEFTADRPSDMLKRNYEVLAALFLCFPEADLPTYARAEANRTGTSSVIALVEAADRLACRASTGGNS